MTVWGPGFRARWLVNTRSGASTVSRTVTVWPGASEPALGLMARSSGSGSLIRNDEMGPPCAVSVNDPTYVRPAGFRWSVTTAGDTARMPGEGPADGDAGGGELAGDTGETECLAAAEAVAAAAGTRGVRTGAVGPVDAVGIVPARAGPDGVPAGPAIAAPGEGGADDLSTPAASRTPPAITARAAAPAPAASAQVTGLRAARGGSSGMGNPDRRNGPARRITPAR